MSKLYIFNFISRDNRCISEAHVSKFYGTFRSAGVIKMCICPYKYRPVRANLNYCFPSIFSLPFTQPNGFVFAIMIP